MIDAVRKAVKRVDKRAAGAPAQPEAPVDPTVRAVSTGVAAGVNRMLWPERAVEVKKVVAQREVEQEAERSLEPKDG